MSRIGRDQDATPHSHRRPWKRFVLLIAVMAAAVLCRGPVLRKVARGHVEAGKGWMAIQRYQDALDDFLAAGRIDPENAQAWYQAGNAYFQLNDETRSAEAYRRAAAIRPDYAPPLKQLGAIDIRHMQFTDAETRLTHYLNLVPGDASAWRLLADAYHQSGNRQGALKAIIEYLKLKPDDGGGWVFLAEAESRVGSDNQLVIEHARKGLTLKAFQPLGYLVLGRTELAMGKTREAVSDITHGLDLLPDNSPDRQLLLLIRAQAAAQSNQPAMSLRDTREAARLQSEQQRRQAEAVRR